MLSVIRNEMASPHARAGIVVTEFFCANGHCTLGTELGYPLLLARIAVNIETHELVPVEPSRSLRCRRAI